MRSDRARYSPAARRDLLAIIEVTKDEWGAEQATKYGRSLQLPCDRLAAYPELAPMSPEFGDVRIFPSGAHRILYRPEGNGVRILRVVHQRMDLEMVGLS